MPEVRALLISPELETGLKELAVAENTSPEVLVARWYRQANERREQQMRILARDAARPIEIDPVGSEIDAYGDI